MTIGTFRCGVLVAALALVASGCLAAGSLGAAPPAKPSSSSSSTTTTLIGGFIPNRLDAPSTMELGFHIHRPPGQTPPPLIGMEFLLPEGVSLTTSELGLELCTSAQLASSGASGCGPNSVMGYGSALIFAPDAAEPVLEPAGVTVFEAPPQDKHTTLLFDASGSSPVITQELFSGEMLDESKPFGANLDTLVPLTPGLPGEPDTTVMHMRTYIGPKGVTYYKIVDGVRIGYTPKGVIVPSTCPPGGFPFGAKFRFADGSTETASTTSPCPSRGSSSRRGRRR
jgi:hypothetical protein